MSAPDPTAAERHRCDTCADSGRVPWMAESDPNLYQEPDADGTVPCPDCHADASSVDTDTAAERCPDCTPESRCDAHRCCAACDRRQPPADTAAVGDERIAEVGAYAAQKEATARAVNDAARMAQIAARRTRQLAAAERALADLRAGVQEVIDARGRGDFAALLPKLRALLATEDRHDESEEG